MILGHSSLTLAGITLAYNRLLLLFSLLVVSCLEGLQANVLTISNFSIINMPLAMYKNMIRLMSISATAFKMGGPFPLLPQTGTHSCGLLIDSF